MIKEYKAYHKARGITFPVSEIDFRRKRIKGRHEDEIISARFDEVELYQYTGVLDDSGRKIFEGDVVSSRTDESTVIVGEIKYEGSEYVVTDNMYDTVTPMKELTYILVINEEWALAHADEVYDGTCPFRDDEQEKCLIYPVRSFICRAFICSKFANVVGRSIDR